MIDKQDLPAPKQLSHPICYWEPTRAYNSLAILNEGGEELKAGLPASPNWLLGSQSTELRGSLRPCGRETGELCSEYPGRPRASSEAGSSDLHGTRAPPRSRAPRAVRVPSLSSSPSIGPSARSFGPAIKVLRLIPDASETRAWQPRPNTSTINIARSQCRRTSRKGNVREKNRDRFSTPS